MAREFDIIVWGATGFTGALVAECLFQRHGARSNVRWAIGGRNAAKLNAVRGQLAAVAATPTATAQGRGAADDLAIVTADAVDLDALRALAARTKVFCTTVGPYARYGSALVEACVAEGTHYCDLTGEVPWMQQMIERFQVDAERSGARIVHTCGFDSIPSDLGVYFVQREMRARYGVAAKQVKYRARGFSGGFSGGTVASMLNMLDEADRDPQIRSIIADAYALNPHGQRTGPDGNDGTRAVYDSDFASWTAPFVMAGINTRVVRRTNALLGFPYGRDFRYDEATLVPGGFLAASAMSLGMGAFQGAAAIAPLRRLLAGVLPKPGDGPTAAQRERGYFDIALLALHPGDPSTSASKNIRATVKGDRDPGYGSTAKMLGEAAQCLAHDALSVGGGFWTPASAMGDTLLNRLIEHAGVSFSLDN